MVAGPPQRVTFPSTCHPERSEGLVPSRFLIPVSAHSQPTLSINSEKPAILLFCGKGTRFLLFPSPHDSSGTHTQMTWNTNDIEADVAALKARGVVFVEYDLPGLKTVNSIATIGQSKGAWFKDSEGNLLALGQFDINKRPD